MMWGIQVELDDHGLTCCGWLPKQVTPFETMLFDTEQQAQAHIDNMPAVSYDQILTPRQLEGGRFCKSPQV